MTILKDIRKIMCSGLGAGIKVYMSAYDVGYKSAVKDMERALKELKP